MATAGILTELQNALASLLVDLGLAKPAAQLVPKAGGSVTAPTASAQGTSATPSIGQPGGMGAPPIVAPISSGGTASYNQGAGYPTVRIPIDPTTQSTMLPLAPQNYPPAGPQATALAAQTDNSAAAVQAAQQDGALAKNIPVIGTAASVAASVLGAIGSLGGNNQLTPDQLQWIMNAPPSAGGASTNATLRLAAVQGRDASKTLGPAPGSAAAAALGGITVPTVVGGGVSLATRTSGGATTAKGGTAAAGIKSSSTPM